MKNPNISVDRASKQVAVFDDFTLVRDFKPYTDEATAVAEAKAFVAERTTVEPTLVYPRIKSMRVTYAR